MRHGTLNDTPRLCPQFHLRLYPRQGADIHTTNTILMNARQFYDLIVELRKAQKQAATTLKYEEIERVAQLERVVDNEIERVTKILEQRNDYGSKD